MLELEKLGVAQKHTSKISEPVVRPANGPSAAQGSAMKGTRIKLGDGYLLGGNNERYLKTV